MNLLADANIEAMVVRWLRSLGHDVVWASDLPPSTPDTELVEIANNEGRVLVTYDRDFGEIVFYRKQITHGIALLRSEASLQADRLALIQRHWASIEKRVIGHFVVVSDRSLRFRPLP